MNVKNDLMSYKTVKPLLLAALVFLLITVCHSLVIHKSERQTAHSADCRVVQHQLGSVCIPVKPKRIIADIGLVDALLALGIRPIGMTTANVLGQELLVGLTLEEIKGIHDAGDYINPSLEKILQLKPDLILGTSVHKNIYQQLSAIAPTILVEDHKHKPIQKTFRYLAQILDKEVEAERVLSQYQARIAELREQLHRRSQEIKVTVLIRYGGSFSLPAPWGATHEIFSDLGVTDRVSDSANPFSLEILDEYDADILFIIDYDGKPDSFFLQNPLMSSLDAVKNNQVYFVKTDNWHPGGPLGLNRMLDDIFKYLLNEKQDLYLQKSSLP